MGNQNFGKSIVSTTYDPKVLNGWNVREYSWDLSVGVQQELAPRVSVEVTYVRRSWGNQTVTDNRAVRAGGLRSVQPHGAGRFATARRRRLPGGRDLTSSRPTDRSGWSTTSSRTPRTSATAASRPTTAWMSTVNARLRGGLQLQGGFNIGQSARTTVTSAAAFPESLTAFGVFRTPRAVLRQRRPGA